jgi:hypothetical protein
MFCLFKVVMHTVDYAMVGMYVCQLVPDNGIPVHTCNLSVTGKTRKAIPFMKQ